jgi:hypothetical protein
MNRIVSIALCVLALAAPAAAQTIDLITPWDGITAEGPFGQPNVATVGENFTVAATEPISSMVFELGDCSGAFTMRVHIWRWDSAAAHATSAIFDSAPISVTASSGFSTYSIGTAGLSLTPGDYVAFMSTSQDQTATPQSCTVGTLPAGTFAGGNLLSLGNGSNPALWTTTAWVDDSADLAFQLNVGATVPAIPEWLQLTTLLAAIGVGAWLLQSRRLPAYRI